jgi:hypothetical protein
LIHFDQVSSSVYDKKSIVKNVETFQITFIGHGIKEIKFVDQLQSNLFILPLLINSNLALDCHRNNDIFICMQRLDGPVTHGHIDVVPYVQGINVVVN